MREFLRALKNPHTPCETHARAGRVGFVGQDVRSTDEPTR